MKYGPEADQENFETRGPDADQIFFYRGPTRSADLAVRGFLLSILEHYQITFLRYFWSISSYLSSTFKNWKSYF